MLERSLRRLEDRRGSQHGEVVDLVPGDRRIRLTRREDSVHARASGGAGRRRADGLGERVEDRARIRDAVDFDFEGDRRPGASPRREGEAGRRRFHAAAFEGQGQRRVLTLGSRSEENVRGDGGVVPRWKIKWKRGQEPGRPLLRGRHVHVLLRRRRPTVHRPLSQRSGGRRAERALDGREHLRGLEVAHHDERHVRGNVARLVVRMHLLSRDRSQRRLAPQDRPRDRRAGERERAKCGLRFVGRIGSVARQLLEDDLALLLEAVRRDRGIEEHVGLNRQAFLGVDLRDEQREERVVLARGRVVVGPDLVHVVVELALRSRLRSVEQEVLEKVRRTRGRRLLVHDARTDDHRRCDHRVRAMLDENDPQPVVERLLHGGGGSCGQSER